MITPHEASHQDTDTNWVLYLGSDGPVVQRGRTIPFDIDSEIIGSYATTWGWNLFSFGLSVSWHSIERDRLYEVGKIIDGIRPISPVSISFFLLDDAEPCRVLAWNTHAYVVIDGLTIDEAIAAVAATQETSSGVDYLEILALECMNSAHISANWSKHLNELTIDQPEDLEHSYTTKEELILSKINEVDACLDPADVTVEALDLLRRHIKEHGSLDGLHWHLRTCRMFTLQYIAYKNNIWIPDDAESLRRLDIVDKYSSGKTLEEIGAVYGVTRERIRQILKKLEWPSRSELLEIQRSERLNEALRNADKHADAISYDWNDNAPKDEICERYGIRRECLPTVAEHLGLKNDIRRSGGERYSELKEKNAQRKILRERIHALSDHLGIPLRIIGKLLPIKLETFILEVYSDRIPLGLANTISKELLVDLEWLNGETDHCDWDLVKSNIAGLYGMPEGKVLCLEDVARRIHEMRARLGISWARIAEAIGASPSGLSDNIKNRLIDPGLVQDISIAFNISLSWLLTGEGEPDWPHGHAQSNEAIASRVEYAIEQRAVSIDDLARHLNLNPKTLKYYLYRRHISESILQGLANRLAVPLAWILGESEFDCRQETVGHVTLKQNAENAQRPHILTGNESKSDGTAEILRTEGFDGRELDEDEIADEDDSEENIDNNFDQDDEDAEAKTTPLRRPRIFIQLTPRPQCISNDNSGRRLLHFDTPIVELSSPELDVKSAKVFVSAGAVLNETATSIELSLENTAHIRIERKGFLPWEYTLLYAQKVPDEHLKPVCLLKFGAAKTQTLRPGDMIVATHLELESGSLSALTPGIEYQSRRGWVSAVVGDEISGKRLLRMADEVGRIRLKHQGFPVIQIMAFDAWRADEDWDVSLTGDTLAVCGMASFTGERALQVECLVIDEGAATETSVKLQEAERRQFKANLNLPRHVGLVVSLHDGLHPLLLRNSDGDLMPACWIITTGAFRPTAIGDALQLMLKVARENHEALSVVVKHLVRYSRWIDAYVGTSIDDPHFRYILRARTDLKRMLRKLAAQQTARLDRWFWNSDISVREEINTTRVCEYVPSLILPQGVELSQMPKHASHVIFHEPINTYPLYGDVASGALENGEVRNHLSQLFMMLKPLKIRFNAEDAGKFGKILMDWPEHSIVRDIGLGWLHAIRCGLPQHSRQEQIWAQVPGHPAEQLIVGVRGHDVWDRRLWLLSLHSIYGTLPDEAAQLACPTHNPSPAVLEDVFRPLLDGYLRIAMALAKNGICYE